MTDVYELPVPLVPSRRGGQPPLNANQRLHWRRRSQLVKRVRTAVAWEARAARIPAAAHITVQLHYQPGDNRRRDPANLTATQKPAVDGLVDAGVVPDDTPQYVTEHMPTIHTGPGPHRLWLEVRIDQEQP